MASAAVDKSGSSESRYMMTMARRRTSPTSNRRRDISINSAKYGHGSSRSNWQGRSMIPGLSFEAQSKNYLPLGALSSVSSQSSDNWAPVGRGSRQSIGRTANFHNPLAIPVIPTSVVSTPTPIPVTMSRENPLAIPVIPSGGSPSTPTHVLKPRKNLLAIPVYPSRISAPTSIPISKPQIIPLAIPVIPFSESSTSRPTSVPILQSNDFGPANLTLRDERKLLFSRKSLPKPIPVSIVEKVSNAPPPDERKIASRNLVRILPHVKPGYNIRRNISIFRNKPQIKNWPNQALQSVQDLLNYEKYTSFVNNDINNSSSQEEKPKAPNRKEPSNKTPDVHWTKAPVSAVASSLNDRIDVDSTMHIDSLLDDLGKNTLILQPQQASTEVIQNTVIHLIGSGFGKHNVTLIEPANMKKANRTKTKNNGLPQKVNIMFMMDKNDSSSGNLTKAQQISPAGISGSSPDCPTIMINSITQINNTIESKEGCTDLNIVINSHVLNTNIFKPASTAQTVLPGNGVEALKNPYATGTPSNNYQTKAPTYVYQTSVPTYNYQTNAPTYNYQTKPSTYNYQTNPSTYNYQTNPSTYNYQNNNYNDDYRDPSNQLQSDVPEPPGSAEPAPEISTFEVFQGTQINVGDGQTAADIPNDTGSESSSGTGEAGTDADGTPLSDPEEGSNDIAGTSPEQGILSDDAVSQGGPTAFDDAPSESVTSDSASEVGQSTGPALAGEDVGTGQAIEAPASVSLPSLPNIPNLSNVPGQLTNAVSNVGGGSAGSGGAGSGGQTALAPVGSADDDDDDDLLEALSPVALLDSMSSVFTYFNALGPINYGIFGMAVAPFMAFAAGVVGVAAFLFPWAFPGSLDFARSWDDDSSIRIRFNSSLRDIVQSSIHKYRHLNEWKGRRRKRKRKR